MKHIDDIIEETLKGDDVFLKGIIVGYIQGIEDYKRHAGHRGDPMNFLTVRLLELLFQHWPRVDKIKLITNELKENELRRSTRAVEVGEEDAASGVERKGDVDPSPGPRLLLENVPAVSVHEDGLQQHGSVARKSD